MIIHLAIEDRGRHTTVLICLGRGKCEGIAIQKRSSELVEVFRGSQNGCVDDGTSNHLQHCVVSAAITFWGSVNVAFDELAFVVIRELPLV
jgi:hypothetical protein